MHFSNTVTISLISYLHICSVPTIIFIFFDILLHSIPKIIVIVAMNEFRLYATWCYYTITFHSLYAFNVPLYSSNIFIIGDTYIICVYHVPCGWHVFYLSVSIFQKKLNFSFLFLHIFFRVNIPTYNFTS